MAEYAKLNDVSYCQSQPIDWAHLAARNVGIIARAGQWNFEDNLFDRHYAGAMAAGVPFGCYWFYQPNMPPEQQIYTFLSIWNSMPVKPKVIFLDVENITYTGVNIIPPGVDIHTVWLAKWLYEVEKATGVIPGIYTRADYWNKWVRRSGTEFYYGGVKQVTQSWNKYPLWVAAWTQYTAGVILPADWQTWVIWQYEGGTGRDEDITGPVDLDRFNGDGNAMRKFFGMPPLVVAPPPGLTLQEQINSLADRVKILEDIVNV
jgi:GH25 family lysozyme M1 (1,4-beta-N-acetylmuramidase)